jgi:septum formation protein
MKRRIILASTSPRRIEILKNAGVELEVAAPLYKEDMAIDLPPQELAKHLAQKKAQSVAGQYPDAVIIGADTIVVLGNTVFGKPETDLHAKEMLSQLSGNIHQVITGYALLDTKSGKTIVRCETTTLKMKPLTSVEIDTYIRTGEPLGKAGAYAIQGKGQELIERVEGGHLNVIGLPVDAVLAALQELGG